MSGFLVPTWAPVQQRDHRDGLLTGALPLRTPGAGSGFDGRAGARSVLCLQHEGRVSRAFACSAGKPACNQADQSKAPFD